MNSLIRLLDQLAILCFYTKPPISMTKVQKLSEYQESFAEKVAKSGYSTLFNLWNGGISEDLYKFASNDNKFYMEQDLNRIKLVLVEKKKTGKWLAQELGVSECTVSRWASNKAQPNLSSLNAIAKLLGVEMKDLLRS